MDRSWLTFVIHNELSNRWYNITKKQINLIIKLICDTILDELIKWIPMYLHRFGKFTITQRKSRAWINPITMDPLIVKAHKTVKFTVSKPFKKKLNLYK